MEILDYDIFNELVRAGLLADLEFQGGTALRFCRGGEWLSEDSGYRADADLSVD
ncbi:MAG: hypothetical protein OXI87_01685 [Albidovulum sp.]|nr:hypothetical protein [Albidovulum sp.]MDE0530920.1 hypothetical protein [Albidovulum sp.]